MRHHGKVAEACPLLAESLFYWEKILQEDPNDQFARHNRRESAFRLRLGQILGWFSDREIDRLTAADWVDRVLRFLSSTPGTDSLASYKEAEDCYRLIELVAERAATQRRNAKLDEAHRTVDRIHALGKTMVARYPDQATAHLYLGVAFVQRAKNAWRFDDRGTVERNWKLAIGEARQTLRLDPRDARAERLVTAIQGRLDDLLAPHKEAKAHVRAAQSALKTGL